jgi:hypothetical protein
VPLDGGPLPEAAKRVDGDFGLLQGGANDVEAAVAEQKFEIGAAGLALAALDHEGKLDPRHRREEANRRIAERMCETLGVGFPQKDGHERGGIDDHSAPHAGLVMGRRSRPGCGCQYPASRPMPADIHQPVSAGHSSA